MHAKALWITALVVALHFGIQYLGGSTAGVVLTLLLAAAVVMAPYRAFQVLSGRLRAGNNRAGLGWASALFLLALLFWAGLIWGVVHVQWLHSCNGDTCIGYSLPGLPFPFVYGLAEALLFKARRSAA